jgi:type II secretory pathway pseudopilin PulG
MIELIIMMSIMALGVTAMFGVIGSGTDFAKDTEDTIKAINLAREGIEWVTDWRNTNWLRFSSDRENCWKAKDYDSTCIGDTSELISNKILSGSYTLNVRNGAWYLSWVAIGGTPATNFSTSWTQYKSEYKTYLDANGFFTQSGITSTTFCSSKTQTGCLTPFTREIRITIGATETGSMQVSSIVRWQRKRKIEIILDTTLTNWKSKF